MITVHPEILKKNKKAEFAVLDYDEYQKLLEYIYDLEDLVDLRKAKEETRDEPTVSLEKVRQTLWIE